MSSVNNIFHGFFYIEIAAEQVTMVGWKWFPNKIWKLLEQIGKFESSSMGIAPTSIKLAFIPFGCDCHLKITVVNKFRYRQIHNSDKTVVFEFFSVPNSIEDLNGLIINKFDEPF